MVAVLNGDDPNVLFLRYEELAADLPGSLRRLADFCGLEVPPQRWPGIPDLPAIAETVPGFESVGFYGISAPKGTPPEVVDTLNKAVAEALKDPKLVAQLAEMGGIPKPMTPLTWFSPVRSNAM